jgi:hypothetical protein
MKFLKHRAPESRVSRGRDSDATILRSKRENPGVFSSALRAVSAIEARLACNAKKPMVIGRLTDLVYAALDLK